VSGRRWTGHWWPRSSAAGAPYRDQSVRVAGWASLQLRSQLHSQLPVHPLLFGQCCGRGDCGHRPSFWLCFLVFFFGRLPSSCSTRLAERKASRVSTHEGAFLRRRLRSRWCEGFLTPQPAAAKHGGMTPAFCAWNKTRILNLCTRSRLAVFSGKRAETGAAARKTLLPRDYQALRESACAYIFFDSYLNFSFFS
jgi:hypothetical protein